MPLPESIIGQAELEKRLNRRMNDVAATFHGQHPDVGYFEIVTHDPESGEHFWGEVHVQRDQRATELMLHAPGYVPSVEAFIDSMIGRSSTSPLVCDVATGARLGITANIVGSLVTTHVFERSTGHLAVHVTGNRGPIELSPAS